MSTLTDYGTIMLSMRTKAGEAFKAAVHVSDDETTRPHQLPMARLVLPIDGWVDLKWAGGEQRSSEPLWTKPDFPSCVVGGAGRTLTLFVDPLAPMARSMTPPSSRALRNLQAAAREVTQVERDGEGFAKEAQNILQTDIRRLDKRVARAAEWLAQNPTASWSMQRISEYAELSPSRLAHLFQSNLRVSARSLALLYRTLAAMRFMADGLSLTEAAHAAGFSDHAHLSRSCIRLLGQPPSRIRDSRIVQA